MRTDFGLSSFTVEIRKFISKIRRHEIIRSKLSSIDIKSLIGSLANPILHHHHDGRDIFKRSIVRAALQLS